MDGLQRGSTAIVGVAESDLGAVAPEMSAIDLMAQGIQRALADCGLQLRDVDGLLCATAQSRTSGLSLAEYLGISPALTQRTIGRRQASAALIHNREGPLRAAGWSGDLP
jgi:hypothetical protein